MNAKENEILEYINTEGFVSVTKDTPKNEQDFIRKLKAFGLLVNTKILVNLIHHLFFTNTLIHYLSGKEKLRSTNLKINQQAQL